MTKRKYHNVEGLAPGTDSSGLYLISPGDEKGAREIHIFASDNVNASKMPHKLLYLILVPVLLAACENREKEVLQQQVDSLKLQLEKSYQTSRTLADIGVLLDSIDATRKLLRVNLVEGTRYEDYRQRLKDLQEYIRSSEEKMARLDQSLKSSNAAAKAFSKRINQLKAQLQEKGEELAFLQEQVEKVRNENESLVITVNLQDAEIADKQEQIDARSQELALIEARVQELMIQAKVSEADAYFMRASAIETAADRTRLAPRKKKETLREALELYKKAQSLGKVEAEAKIAELEERL